MQAIRITLMSAVLALSGCVFEDRCVGGAVRDERGLCTRGQSDAGSDAGRDAGRKPDSGTDDGGTGDGGIDGGGAHDAGMDAGPPATIVDFAVGAAHACVVDSTGALTCWGANLIGQLGSGDISAQAGPRRIELGAPVVSVGAGAAHSCAATTEPAVYCWGLNDHGQIGNGTASGAAVTMPHKLAGLGTSRSMSGAHRNTCVIAVTGTTQCWGRNDEGQLAIGTASADVTAPGSVARSSTGELSPVMEAAIGGRHICFVTGGHLLCAGDELGTPDLTADIATPVPGMNDIASVAAYAGHTCAVQDGSVYCWGTNEFGQVMPGGPDHVPEPTAVSGVDSAIQVATGEGHTCALLESGSVVCWGTRSYGALGDGGPTSDTSVAAPVPVAGLVDVSQIKSNMYLVCGLTSSGELHCWGEDASALSGGIAPGADSVFLDGETMHAAPVRVNPLL